MTETKMVELFAVQPYVSVETYVTEEAFRAKVRSLGEKIAGLRAKGPDGKPLHAGLAVFPEELGTFLAMEGFGKRVAGAKTSDEAMNRVGLSLLPRILWNLARFRSLSIHEGMFLTVAPKVHRIVFTAFRDLARELRLWVVGGSALLPRNRLGEDTEAFSPAGREIYNTSYTFDPAGRCVNVTRKVNLVPTQEDVIHLTAGRVEWLAPVSTDLGRVGNMICYDGFREAHTRNERFVTLGEHYDRMGVEILVQPAANPWPWEEPWVFNEPGEKLLRKEQWMCEGLFEQLKSLKNVRYAVNPHLIGAIFDHRFDGRSFIFENRGAGEVAILAEARRADLDPAAEEVVWARAPAPN